LSGSRTDDDPTVQMRAGLAQVTQCGIIGPCRPEALLHHDEFKHLYPQTQAMT
jgi:hypothetical protein